MWVSVSSRGRGPEPLVGNTCGAALAAGGAPAPCIPAAAAQTGSGWPAARRRCCTRPWDPLLPQGHLTGPARPVGACPPRGCPYRPCRGSAAPPRVLAPLSSPQGPDPPKRSARGERSTPAGEGAPGAAPAAAPTGRGEQSSGGLGGPRAPCAMPPSFWDFPEDILQTWKVGLALSDLKKASAVPPATEKERNGRETSSRSSAGGAQSPPRSGDRTGVGTNVHPLLSQRAPRASTGRPRALAPRRPDCRDTCEENVCF